MYEIWIDLEIFCNCIFWKLKFHYVPYSAAVENTNVLAYIYIWSVRTVYQFCNIFQLTLVHWHTHILSLRAMSHRKKKLEQNWIIFKWFQKNSEMPFTFIKHCTPCCSKSKKNQHYAWTRNLFPLLHSDTNIYIQEINKPDLNIEVNNKSTKVNDCKKCTK